MDDHRRFDARMTTAATAAMDRLRTGLLVLEPHAVSARVGEVVAVADGVARVAGLEGPIADELVDVGGLLALASEVAEHETRVILLGRSERIQAGDTVRRLGRVLDVPAGPELLGRVVDPMGRPLDGRGPLGTRRRVAVEPTPVPLRDREPVTRSLRTGVFTLDTMIPIGRGQRQLVIGDRSTGKTRLCLSILAALDPEVIGVYVAIGRRGAETAAHLERLRAVGMLEHGFAVVADADDPIGLIHLAPYAACAMAEDMALAGRDVVIVYDDLTNHAHAHRTLALLLGRPVGREAHPVDVFYAHARLLERSTQLSESRGGGSSTAFPIVETQAGDLTGYIPTNLVSITDGQVRLDAALAAAGLVPAVDVGLSVSRVGGRAQLPLLRTLAGAFKNRYAQFLELESFARFGTRLEPGAQQIVDWGQRVRRVLSQPWGASRSWLETVARLLLVGAPGFHRLPLEGLEEAIATMTTELSGAPELDRDAIVGDSAPAEMILALRTRARRLLEEHLPDEPEAGAHSPSPEIAS